MSNCTSKCRKWKWVIEIKWESPPRRTAKGLKRRCRLSSCALTRSTWTSWLLKLISNSPLGVAGLRSCRSVVLVPPASSEPSQCETQSFKWDGQLCCKSLCLKPFVVRICDDSSLWSRLRAWSTISSWAIADTFWRCCLARGFLNTD